MPCFTLSLLVLIHRFFISYATPVKYGFLFFITYLILFKSLRATLIITLCPLLLITCL